VLLLEERDENNNNNNNNTITVKVLLSVDNKFYRGQKT